MAVTSFRRSRHVLSAADQVRLVTMRDGGATWQAIGRVFGMQDGHLKRAYDLAKAEVAAPIAA